MEYMIVRADKLDDLTQQVNDAIAQGWKPQGGISAISRPDTLGFYFYQAMVRSK